MPVSPEYAPPVPPWRRWLSPSLATVLILVACSGALAVPAHAADDSNAGQLSQAPTVAPAQLASTMGTLAQGTNDTQLQQLLSQFQSQLSSGNDSGAASTLGQLQNLSATQPGSVPPSLNALLKSLSVGNNGASVNSGLLSSLLSSGSSNEPPNKLSTDMQSLAGLMQYVNSTLASELLQNSSLLSQSGFAGSNGVSLGGAPVALPSLSGSAGISLPSAGAPSLSVGAVSGRLPSIPLTTFVIPLVVAGVATVLFFSRGRVVRLIGSHKFPGITLLAGKDEGEQEVLASPSDPRKRIEFYFGKAVRLMGRRGVPKMESETHREFSANCEGTPERPHVRTITSLYEKAKFSGQEVRSPDADLAAAELSAMGKEER